MKMNAKEAEHQLLKRISELRVVIRNAEKQKAIAVDDYVSSLEDQINIISDLIQTIRLIDFNLT